jgi:hypothetical protein
MSATLLEQTRAAHEEVERLEKCVVQELQRDTKSHKERLHQNHRVNNMLLASLASTTKLVCSRVSFCRFFLSFLKWQSSGKRCSSFIGVKEAMAVCFWASENINEWRDDDLQSTLRMLIGISCLCAGGYL